MHVERVLQQWWEPERNLIDMLTEGKTHGEWRDIPLEKEACTRTLVVQQSNRIDHLPRQMQLVRESEGSMMKHCDMARQAGIIHPDMVVNTLKPMRIIGSRQGKRSLCSVGEWLPWLHRQHHSAHG
jgi:hypothetical protein